MEKLFVNNNFRYVELVPISNGKSWTIDAIANQITSKYVTKNYNPDIIIVWLDREDESRPADSMKIKIREALGACGVELNIIHILIPNRMSENIILSDNEVMREVFNDPNYYYKYEGENGKGILKDMYRNKNCSYKETAQGAMLLKKIRINRCALNSKSVKDFYDNFPLKNCWWI